MIQPAGTVLSERGSSALSGEVASAKTRPAEPPRSESTDHFKPDFKKGKK